MPWLGWGATFAHTVGIVRQMLRPVPTVRSHVDPPAVGQSIIGNNNLLVTAGARTGDARRGKNGCGRFQTYSARRSTPSALPPQERHHFI